jgi:hypothetical protein
VVKAVDENGRPTEWEAADLPSGGSGGSAEWTLINDIVLDEEVATLTVNTDSNGNAFAVKELLFRFEPVGGTGNTNKTQLHIYPNPTNAGVLRASITEGVYAKNNVIVISGIVRLVDAGTYCYEVYKASSLAYHIFTKYSDLTALSSMTFYIGTEGYTFGVGSTLRVWGR